MADVTTFLAATGSTDAELARTLIEAANGSIDSAVELFFDMESAVPAPPPASRSSTVSGVPTETASVATGDAYDDYGSTNHRGDDSVRAPEATRFERLQSSDAGFIRGARQSVVPTPQVNVAFRNHAAETAAAGGRGGGKRDLASIMRPPTQLIYPGTFAEARNAARSSDMRWLIVNIQDDTVFDSWRLNRDVWADETVESLISAGFVFWQQHVDIQDPSNSSHRLPNAVATNFLATYSLRRGADYMPLIAVIDPRTAELVSTHIGYISARFLVERLSDFTSAHSLHDERPISRVDTRWAGDSVRPVVAAAPIVQTIASREADTHAVTLSTTEWEIDAAIAESISMAAATAIAAVATAASTGEASGRLVASCENDAIDTNDARGNHMLGNASSATARDGAVFSDVQPGSRDAKRSRMSTLSQLSPVAHDAIEGLRAAPPPLLAALPPEPTTSVGVTRIAVVLPNGRRIVRRFFVSEAVAALYAVAAAEMGSSHAISTLYMCGIVDADGSAERALHAMLGSTAAREIWATASDSVFNATAELAVSGALNTAPGADITIGSGVKTESESRQAPSHGVLPLRVAVSVLGGWDLMGPSVGVSLATFALCSFAQAGLGNAAVVRVVAVAM